MTAADWRSKMTIAQGGLMRCCTESLRKQLAAMTEAPADGTVLDCEYEPEGNGQLILDVNVWRWNKNGEGLG